MKWAVVVLAFALESAVALPVAGQQLLGSGSTFALPVMAKWSQAYQDAKQVHIEYQPIGSAGGLTEIRAGVVDFGVSDAPLDDYQLLRDGLAQFPIVIGAIVPVVNLDGVTSGELRFTGELLADIFLGKVKRWSDPSISALNPNVRLPDRAIIVVHRSDGSGTTYNWTDYLSKVSAEWKTKVGFSTMVAWPTGAGGKGNSGVADDVLRMKGAIGYVEYGYAERKRLTYGLVQNHARKFPVPGASSLAAAVAAIDWSEGRSFSVSVTDAPGADAYPIMAASFVLMRKYPKNVDRSRDVLNFFLWALEHGQDMAGSLNYLPLPPRLVQGVENYWDLEFSPVAKGSSPPRQPSKKSG